MTVVSNREIAKNKRREALLDASERLIRASGKVDFSMQALAAEAGLSLATAYNLFGSKSAVLYALLNRRAEEMEHWPGFKTAPAAPFAAIEQGVVYAAHMFAGERGFFQPLMLFLLGAPDPVHRPAFMARGLAFWSRLASALPPPAEAAPIARALHVAFTGALDMWAHDELDEAGFVAELLGGWRLIARGLRGGAGPPD